jgi:polyadenylate-binding protein
VPTSITDPFHSTADDDALRAKVEEAMHVYDEYVKSQGGENGPQANGENLNPTAEEVKDAEA